ncbi:MAG: type IV pilus modification protein PilV [Mariprofundaceae bacterium]|nr:type IV pilus modification protein PilV [Mariprofundaceae bacterium]
MLTRFSEPLKNALMSRAAAADVVEDPQRHAGMRGFSLIEVMVAVIILAVGLMGLAGLQSAALRSTHMSYMRTQAGIAAMEMAERMRANKTGVDTLQYAAISSPPAGTAPTSCITNNCLAAAVAAHDAYTWTSALANSTDLLSAQGSVTCLASPCVVGSQYRITVMWDGRRNGATGTGCDSANTSDLLCHRITVLP